MAALKTTITPARRSPPKRISASDAVAMEETITLVQFSFLRRVAPSGCGWARGVGRASGGRSVRGGE